MELSDSMDLVRARCSRSGLPLSWCIHPWPAAVSAGDSNQLHVFPASITNDSHSGGTQSRVLDNCDDAAGVDTAAIDVPETPIFLSSPLEPPELIFPPDVIQFFCVLKRIPRASRHLAATKLARILEDASKKNDSGSWSRLFKFSCRCLAVLRRVEVVLFYFFNNYLLYLLYLLLYYCIINHCVIL